MKVRLKTIVKAESDYLLLLFTRKKKALFYAKTML